MVPSRRGLSLPTRPIASALLSRISEVTGVQKRRYTCFNPFWGLDYYGYVLQGNSRGNTVKTDELPIKTGAAALKGGTGCVLLTDGVPTMGTGQWNSGWLYL